MKEYLKEHWNNFNLREKRMVAGGLFFIAILFVYFWIWSPLSNQITHLQQEILQNQQLVVFMRETDKHIRTLEKMIQKKPVAQASGSLLSIIQKHLNGTQFVSNLTQLHQTENESVQLTFDKIDFDKLMGWLLKLAKENQVVIEQITVAPSATPGLVSVDLMLKQG